MQFKIDKKFIEKYGKYMILGAVALLLVIILIVSALTRKPEVPAGQSVEPTTDVPVTEPSETEPPLQEDAYPEINQLFETYFTAKKELNVDQLNSIVVQEEPYTLEEIEKRENISRTTRTSSVIRSRDYRKIRILCTCTLKLNS